MLKKIIGLSVTGLTLILLIGPYLGTESKENPDQCVLCHTDATKMKTLITRFPEPSAEEGEG